MQLPSFFNEMDDSYRKLDVAILALACELFELAPALPKNPFVPQALKESLVDAHPHFERMIRELLEFRQEVKTKKNLNIASCASITSSFLDVFHVLKPLYAICFAMNYITRCRESLRFQNLYLLIMDNTNIREINIFDSAVSKIVDKTCQDLKIWFREGFNMYTNLTLALDQHLQKSNVFPNPMLSIKKKHNTLEYKIRVEQHTTMNEKFISTYQPISLMSGIVVATPASKQFIVDGTAVPKAPNILRHWSQDTRQDFMAFLYEGESLALNILAQIILILSCIKIRCFPSLERMEGGWSVKDAEAAGPLIFHDTQLSSICFGRRKQREIYLFQHFLMLARRKRGSLVVVQKINLEKLLFVVYQNCGEFDVLSIYWEGSSSTEQRVQCIDMYFKDKTPMQLWAGFLSMSTLTARKLPASVEMFPKSIQIETSDLNRQSSNNHLLYLAQLGPTSIRQAIDIILPLIKSIIQSLPYYEGILPILTSLGQKLSTGIHDLCSDDSSSVAG